MEILNAQRIKQNLKKMFLKTNVLIILDYKNVIYMLGLNFYD